MDWAETLDVAVVGGGVGGLCAALHLAGHGARVAVFDRASEPGGKMRVVDVGRPVDAGPTVLTMLPVFEALFADTGLHLHDWVTVLPLQVLARHAWTDGTRLDLFAERDRSADAIAQVFGQREAAGYRRFADQAARIYEAIGAPFVRQENPDLWSTARRAKWSRVFDLLRVAWHRNLWTSLGSFFREPKLRQLFGRYATYCGSSPFSAPATLALIAHVEQRGVWAVQGGMIELARALARAVTHHGGMYVPQSPVAEIEIAEGRVCGIRLADGTRVLAPVVVANVDPRAVASGRLGAAVATAVRGSTDTPRSLSAMTWCLQGRVQGFDLEYHNVFFGDDYRTEFDDVFVHGRVPNDPTIYVCAQDRLQWGERGGPERLFVLVNAPPRGDDERFSRELEAWQQRIEALVWARLRHHGLAVEFDPRTIVTTTPAHFEAMFPGSGGALYGSATHSPWAPLSRPAPRTTIPGLYLVGGGVHPGAGVPMVALGGRHAGRMAIADHPSMRTSRPAATCGGTSTSSATTAATR